MTIRLRHPIAHGPRLVTEVSLRRPEPQEFDARPRGVSEELHAVALMTSLPHDVAAKMEPVDWAQVAREYDRIARATIEFCNAIVAACGARL